MHDEQRLDALRSARWRQSEVGNVAAIDVKISSDMPLPMPRSVMSSPIHMMRPVPAVMVMTMSMIAYQESSVISWVHSATPELCRRARRCGRR